MTWWNQSSAAAMGMVPTGISAAGNIAGQPYGLPPTPYDVNRTTNTAPYTS